MKYFLLMIAFFAVTELSNLTWSRLTIYYCTRKSQSLVILSSVLLLETVECKLHMSGVLNLIGIRINSSDYLSHNLSSAKNKLY